MSQLLIVFKIKLTLQYPGWLHPSFLFPLTSDHAYPFLTRCMPLFRFFNAPCFFSPSRPFYMFFPLPGPQFSPSNVIALESSHPCSVMSPCYTPPAPFFHGIYHVQVIYLYDYLINIWVPFQNIVVRRVGTRPLLLTIEYWGVSLAPVTKKGISMPLTSSEGQKILPHNSAHAFTEGLKVRLFLVSNCDVNGEGKNPGICVAAQVFVKPKVSDSSIIYVYLICLLHMWSSAMHCSRKIVGVTAPVAEQENSPDCCWRNRESAFTRKQTVQRYLTILLPWS